MSDSPNDKPVPVTARTRTRSPAYPLFSLRAAVEYAEKLWKAQNRHSGHIDSVLGILGFTKATGASLRAVAALSQFGLTKESGSQDKRSIALSELGLDLVAGSNEQKVHGRKIAALKPTIYKELWERYGPNPPSSSVIEAFLVRDKGYNPSIVEALVRDYLITLEFANLDGSIPVDEPKILHAETSRIPFKAGDVTLTKHPAPTAKSTTEVQYLPIPLDIGNAQIPVGMSQGDYDLLLETLRLWKKKIMRMTVRFSFNSLADLDLQIDKFSEEHPSAELDDNEVGKARARAQELDNDGQTVGSRITLQIAYTES